MRSFLALISSFFLLTSSFSFAGSQLRAGGVVDGQQLFDGGHVLSLDNAERKLYSGGGTTVALDWSSGIMVGDGSGLTNLPAPASRTKVVFAGAGGDETVTMPNPADYDLVTIYCFADSMVTFADSYGGATSPNGGTTFGIGMVVFLFSDGTHWFYQVNSSPLQSGLNL